MFRCIPSNSRVVQYLTCPIGEILRRPQPQARLALLSSVLVLACPLSHIGFDRIETVWRACSLKACKSFTPAGFFLGQCRWSCEIYEITTCGSVMCFLNSAVSGPGGNSLHFPPKQPIMFYDCSFGLGSKGQTGERISLLQCMSQWSYLRRLACFLGDSKCFLVNVRI